MGIGGHILGTRKLRQLSNRSGLSLATAYRLTAWCEGVVHTDDGGCIHYKINWETGSYEKMSTPFHWTSCRLWREEKVASIVHVPIDDESGE